MHVWRIIVFFCVNVIYKGPNPRYFPVKRWLLNSIGYKIGKNTKIVAPIYCTGSLTIGDNCWIGADFRVWGNGHVILGNNIDVAPNVSFYTGSHYIGNESRRAGDGYNCTIIVHDGCWICGGASFTNDIEVGQASVVAACACVVKNISSNVLVGGVPAKNIKELNK